MNAPVHRLAIGLLAVDGRLPSGDRHRAHLSLTTRADHVGYALVDILELPGDPDLDEAALNLLEETASGLDLQAVLLAGPIPPTTLARVEELASRARLLVLPEPHPRGGAATR